MDLTMVRLVKAGAALLGALVWTAGCDKPKEPAGGSAPPQVTEAPVRRPDPIERMQAPERLVAVGDLHGDLTTTRAVLRLSGAIDEQDRWSGGKLVLVQVGDAIDRGDEDRQVLELLERLREEAAAAGGKVVALIGNHEAMNVQLQFDYVTPAALQQFANVEGLRLQDPRVTALPERARARAGAFVPGGPYANKLARLDAIAIVGDTVFVHGGVEPKHVDYGLDRINRELSRWMKGESPVPNQIVGEGGPLWSRRYSAAPDASDCASLERVLQSLQLKRMVVGHTVQRGGISPACEAKIWRIDVGLSRHYGGPQEALEIKGGEVRTLRAAAHK
jgi:hypothetical protein